MRFVLGSKPAEWTNEKWAKLLKEKNNFVKALAKKIKQQKKWVAKHETNYLHERD